MTQKNILLLEKEDDRRMAVTSNAKKKIAARMLCDDENTTHHGYLTKFNLRGKEQIRFCVINNGAFYYYKKPDSERQQGNFCISGYEAKIGEKGLEFQVKHLLIKDGKRIYTFKCAVQGDRDVWVKKFNDSVIKYFPTSLYPPDGGPSSIDYEYISNVDIVKTIPREYKSAVKKIGNFVGPRYGGGGSAVTPTWVPPTPQVPERSVASMNMKCNNGGSYELMDKLSEVPEHHSRNPLRKQVELDHDDAYMTMDREQKVDPSSMKDAGDYITMDGEQKMECYKHEGKDANEMYEQLSYDDGYYDDDDDSDDDDDDFANKFNTTMNISQSASEVNKSDKTDHISKETRSVSLTIPGVPHHVMERFATVPPFEGSDRSAAAPPLSPRVPRQQKAHKSILEKLSDEDVIPQSCRHVNVGRDQCLGLLHPFEVGTYLIRTAEDGKDRIAVVARKILPKVRHFMVFECGQGKKYLEKTEPKFTCLPELIKHYYKNYLPQTELYLSRPMSKT